MDIGSTRLGMTVAEKFRRNRKITITTSPSVKSRVNCTSWAESRMGRLLSRITSRVSAAGSFSRSMGSRALMASATATVLVPGWR